MESEIVYIPKYERLRLAEEYFRVDNWDESKHPRDDKGRFTNGSIRDKINREKFEPVRLSWLEYGKVVHILNTDLTREQRKQKTISKCIGDFIYTVEIHGFNDYIITKKEKIDVID